MLVSRSECEQQEARLMAIYLGELNMVEREDSPAAGEDNRGEFVARNADETATAFYEDAFRRTGGCASWFPQRGNAMSSDANADSVWSTLRNPFYDRETSSDKNDAVGTENDLRYLQIDDYDKKPNSDNRAPCDTRTYKTEGTHSLRTGDLLMVKDGTETLITPGGDILTVDRHGNVTVSGAVKGVETIDKSTRIYTMADDAKITVMRFGITHIARNGQSVGLAGKDPFLSGGYGSRNKQ